MISRRHAIKAAVLSGAALAIHPLHEALGAESPAPAKEAPASSGPFTLPPLPYAPEALEPHIDARTMSLHHHKHHATYVKNLNAALVGQEALAARPIEHLLLKLADVPEEIRQALRNNGGGHYNHSLFWQMLSPKGGGEPKGALAKAISAKFGSFPDFQAKLNLSAASVFGSGWAWLVLDGSELALTTTPNQDSPLSSGQIPILGVDLWEHAYYLQYQNRRADYLKAWWNVVNWSFVSERYEKALM